MLQNENISEEQIGLSAKKPNGAKDNPDEEQPGAIVLVKETPSDQPHQSSLNTSSAQSSGEATLDTTVETKPPVLMEVTIEQAESNVPTLPAPATLEAKPAPLVSIPTAEIVADVPLIPIPITSDPKRPTTLEVFTGQAVDILDKLFDAQKSTDKLITELRKARQQTEDLFNEGHNSAGQLKHLEQVKASIQAALTAYQWTPTKLWLYQWSLMLHLAWTGLLQIFFIEIYCRWHGSYFVSLNLFDPLNIEILSKIDFVNGATTMSVAGEVLTWSSLGVWAQQSYANTVAMLERKFRFADHGPQYIGIMMRNTSVAAVIIILLRLSKFSIFGVALDETSPLAFDATVGLAFLLGFFGNDASRILSNIKDGLVKKTQEGGEEKS